MKNSHKVSNFCIFCERPFNPHLMKTKSFFFLLFLFHFLGIGCLSEINAQVEVYEVSTGNQAISDALGGGELPSHALVIGKANLRGTSKLTPAQFGAKSLSLIKKMDEEHFLFVALDEIDIQDYYLFFSSQDKAYKVNFELGEHLGYHDFSEQTRFQFILEEHALHQRDIVKRNLLQQ